MFSIWRRINNYVRVSLQQLQLLLLQNVVELKFTRRRPKPGAPSFRRMLATNNYGLLNSIQGRTGLNYRPPTHQPDYQPNLKGLIVTWDIFMQDYRQIPVAATDVISVIPANEEFWEYFNSKLAFMSPKEKFDFMRV